MYLLIKMKRFMALPRIYFVGEGGIKFIILIFRFINVTVSDIREVELGSAFPPKTIQ